MRQKLSELPAEPAPTAEMAAPAPAPAKVPTVAAPAPAPAKAPVMQELPVQARDQQSIERARAAVRQKMDEISAAPAPTPAPAPAPAVAAAPAPQNEPAPPAEPKKPKQPAPRAASGFEPIAAPPLPISAEKQQKLTELNRRYFADEITPDQYHLERAKILGQK
jgi:hypothetical protein